jgi:hypothetical protein
LEIDYFKKLIDLIDEEIGEDMKKKFGSGHYPGSNQTKPSKES